MPAETNWIDIIPPPAPPPDTMAWAWLVLPVLVTVLVLLYYRLRPRPAGRRKLRRLRRQIASETTPRKTATFLLAGYLREAFATHRLDSIDFPATQQGQWRDFVGRLQHQQYSAAVPEQAELDRLLQDAIGWLSR